MKTAQQRIERYQAMLNLLKTAPTLFAQYEADAAKLSEFETKLAQLNEAYANLLTPAVVYKQQISEQREQLRADTVSLLNRGLAVAASLEDAVLRESFRMYVRQTKKAGTFELLHITELVCKSLTDNQVAADAVGLTADYIAGLRTKVSGFTTQQEQTTTLYAVRKIDRSRINRLLHELHQLLLLHIDPAVAMLTNKRGDFYEQWKNLRAVVRRRKKAGGSSTLATIIGTVTDAESGQPLTDAMVTVVEQQAVETTDADGMFLIEGLLPGWITVACSAAGFAVAENQRLEIREGEELQVNFALNRQVAASA